jgi:hypothetical protein
VILLVDRPFTDQDTLYFGAVGNGTVITLEGPFTNLQTIPISISPNIGTSSAEKYESYRTGKGQFWWGIGSEEFKNVSFNPDFQVPPNLIRGPYQKVCEQGGDVMVDLRNR